MSGPQEVFYKVECPACKTTDVPFAYMPVAPDSRRPDIRSLIEDWPQELKPTERFDPQYIAYLQRVRASARVLPLPHEPIPATAQVCCFCMARGDLNEALNEIAIQGQSQLKSYDEVVQRMQMVKDKEVEDISEIEFQEVEEELRRELMQAEMLDAECEALESQLESEIRATEAIQELCLAAQNRVSVAQQTLESIEVRLNECRLQAETLPKSIHEVWNDFFPIDDHFTYAAIHGIPLACLTKGDSDSWSASCRDAQNISAAMVLMAALLGRLTTLVPVPNADIMRDRPYRILATPTSVEGRSSQLKNYPLIPFVNEKAQSDWAKGLRILADCIGLLFKCWAQNPTHPMPSSSDGDSYYALDPNKPDTWNEKMRHLLLNVLSLRNLRFPPP